MMFMCNYIISLLSFLARFVKSDEDIYVLNHNRPLNVVSDKFLSFSIDPSILLTSINLRGTKSHRHTNIDHLTSTTYSTLPTDPSNENSYLSISVKYMTTVYTIDGPHNNQLIIFEGVDYLIEVKYFYHTLVQNIYCLFHSNVSLQIASHMSPAYVRIAGPSTEFVKYIDTDDKSVEIGSSDVDSVTVTPSVWFAINEWFAMANLTPVFGINDAETVMGVWNPKSILPLLELSDKFNVSCMWQLGYDCSNKSSVQYIEDLRILRHILDAFQDRRDSWKIVGSNIRECVNTHDIRRMINELKGISDFVMWERSENEIDPNKVKDDFARFLISPGSNHLKIWTTGSKSHHTVTFETALQWAKEVGEAARQGFHVILRQPRIYEFFVDTPVFWFSLLYKTLVGNIVLDLKSTGTQYKGVAFAYCAKNQNNFIQRGAMTLMIVNQEDTESKINLKMTALPSSIEVQSYILSTKSDMRFTYLNNERLRADILQADKILFTSKLRRAKPSNGISLIVPSNSIAFFVLPGAKIPTCVDEDDEMTLLMEEIKEDQELPFSEEIAVDLKSRIFQRNLSLREMRKNLEDELEADEKFYHMNRKGKANERLDDVLENLKEKYDNEESQTKLQFKVDEETRKIILERAKLAQTQKKITESEQRLLDFGKLFMSKSNHLPKSHDEMVKNSVEIFSPVNDIDTFEPKSHSLNLAKSRTEKLRELLANKPKHKFILFDFKNNHQHNDHEKIEHTKLSKSHPKTLNEQLREILEEPKSNFHRKYPAVEKSPEKSMEVELELSSAEIKKVLMDRVKSRAARTNIRFTNEELVDIMKKATARLKHDHILKHRSRRLARRDTEFIRSKRDINMKLLNEIAKRQDSNKETKIRNIYDKFEENSETIPEKPSKSKTFRNPKPIIVSPYSKISEDGKQSKLKDRRDSDLKYLETKDDWDYYSDEDDSEEGGSFHDTREFKPFIRKPEKLKIPVTSKIGKIKMKSVPVVTTRAHDMEDSDDLYKKFSRLDEYFRNAKEFQEKFDDIDFSDESDYGNIDSDEKHMRLKRSDVNMNKRHVEKEINNCECKDSGKINNKSGCSCRSPILHELMKEMKPLIGNVSNEDLLNFFQQNSKRYAELSDSLNKRIDEKRENRKVLKVRRTAYRNDAPTNYKPMYHSDWRPQDVMSLHKHSTLQSKYPSKIINDLPFYEHLLHSSMRRSIMDNEISDDSNENRESNMNKIEKDIFLKSLRGDNFTAYKVVLPNKDELELRKNNNSIRFRFEHGHNSSLNGVKSVEIDLDTDNDTETSSKKITSNTYFLNRNMIVKNRIFKNKKASNIQQIPKKLVNSAFQKVLHHLTSFVCQMGSKIKNYFNNLMK